MGRIDPETFWENAAKELHWFRTWDKVFEWNYPNFRCLPVRKPIFHFNALDVHVKEGWGGHTALIYMNERGERRLFTYAKLLHDVEKIAASLRGMGISKGDRVTVYMPTCREAIMLMLAVVRIA